MAYIISNSQGQAVVIPDGSLNDDYSISLVGRNYGNYGFPMARNLLHMLENFANTTPPSNATSGQLWYDLDKKILRVFDFDTFAWVPTGVVVTESSAPTDGFGLANRGAQYFNRALGQAFTHDGTSWIRSNVPGEVSGAYSAQAALGNPTSYGSKIRNIYLTDSGGVPRAVLAVVLVNNTLGYSGNEKLVAIISGHSQFTAANTNSQTEGSAVNYFTQLTESGGIGAVIRPGINIRQDNASRVEAANIATRAETAYAINTGSYGNDGANISASSIFHEGKDLIPFADDQYTIGSSGSVYSEAHITQIVLGNGGVGSIEVAPGSMAVIGSSLNPIDIIYTDALSVSGDILLGGGGTVGTPSAPVPAVYADQVTTDLLEVNGYTLSTAPTANGQQLYSGANSQIFWADISSDISDITDAGGITVTSVPMQGLGPNEEVTQRIIELSIAAGDGIEIIPGGIQVNLGDFSTSDLNEGTRLYFTNARARQAISAGSGITYDPGTGEISLTAFQGPGVGYISEITAANGLSGGGTGSTVSLSVGAGAGIQVNANNVAVIPSFIRGLISAGSGINYNSSNGQISWNAPAGFENFDVANFVQVSGNQNVGGIKTFAQRPVFNGGITTNSINYSSLTFSASSGSVTFSGSGDIVASGDITAFSDASLKKNIKPLTGALDKISRVSGYSYTRKDLGRKQIGVLAQEIKEIMPEAVIENSDGIMGVSYNSVVAMLLQAVNELSQEVAELKKQLRQ